MAVRLLIRLRSTELTARPLVMNEAVAILENVQEQVSTVPPVV